MPTKLRIALVAGLLAFASNLLIIGFIHWQTRDQIVANERKQVAEQWAVLRDIYRASGEQGLRRAIDDTIGAGDPQMAAAILTSDGRPIYGNVSAVSLKNAKPSAGPRSVLLTIDREATPREAAVGFMRLADGRWLLSGRTVAEGISLRETLERSLLVGLAVSALLGLICGWVIGQFVDRRVRDIVAVADRIGGGDLSERVPHSGGRDSFERLAERINQMLDRIATLMNELRMLTDSLAHELRSPVGRLRAAADAAISASDPQERDKLLGDVIRQSDALMRILTTVLEIARTESFTAKNQFSWVDPGELGLELAEMYEPVAEEAGASLTLDRQPILIPIAGHRQLLAQALSNLIENAIKYSGPGGEIRLFVREDEKGLSLGVSDHGPGIPAEREGEARKRFGRLDPSRTLEGAGLGLSLVQAIAHLHEGELVLDDNEPGLIARLEIPLNGVKIPDSVGAL